MSRRGAAIILSRSRSVVASSSSSRRPVHRFLLNMIPRRDCVNRSCCSSSSQDELIGLVDHDGRDSLRAKPVSPEDFAFLRADAHLERILELGKVSDDAVSIADAINANPTEFGDDTHKFLSRFRKRLDSTLVIDVLRGLRSPELAIRFFTWAGQQIGYVHSGPVYHALIERLGFGKNNRIPEHLFNEIRDDDREVLGKLFNILVRKFCQNGWWNEALEELGRLKDFGYRPSRTTYSALIQVFLRAERLDSAFLVYREMSDSGFELDGFTLGCFAQSLCKAGRWDEALNIIEKEDFTPDAVIYTKMINGLLEGSFFNEAMSFLHRMRSSSCVPNLFTYETLLSGFLRSKQLSRCKKILYTMMAEGMHPSISLFNGLIHAFCSSGDYSFAYNLLDKMRTSRSKPGYVSYNILIGGICGKEDIPSSEMLELAEKAYEEMLKCGFVLNKINVGHFARCLCSMGKYNKAFDVIKQLMNNGFVPDTSTYSKVIELLCQSHMIEKALRLFDEMKRNGAVPDVYVYTILIDSFCKVGLLQQALHLFNGMKSVGCSPNVVTYTTLIHASLKARRVSEANELFEGMISAGCKPNVVTYTALIDGFCKAGEVDKACHIYARMRGDASDEDVNKYFEGNAMDDEEPNVFTYGALVDGLCKAHKVVEARHLLEAMSVVNCEPNHIVYDALIDGFCKVGQLDEARDVFIKMSENGCSPSVYTYSSLIDRLFKDQRLDLALKVVAKMLENSCPPNVVTYTEMIDGLCKMGKIKEAYKLLLLMEEKGCNPSVVTYTAMIDGFGKVGKIKTCFELFGQMIAKGVAPNFVTYRILINHCCAAGLLDDAHRLLEEMKQTYWPTEITGYRNVIQGFSRDFMKSLGFVEDISEYSLVTSVPIGLAYSILIDSFCKAGRLEVALELHKEVMTSYSAASASATENMLSSLVEGLCLAGEIEKAFELYSDAVKRGHIPELTVFVYLIKGLLKVKKWEEALQLSHSVCHMDVHWHIKLEAFDGG
ncbi:Pentatricopeptide repeat-containing protein [Acorus calamus]|uniref:Pentatricopeptide repeat-containing protein n=1 Tax=Acorus calamus TaxID=4465 RepID=A0AAV9EQM0_ACOCL|nr:Pentatricopeptide repeat-containing protein [Acorus calamus]